MSAKRVPGQRTCPLNVRLTAGERSALLRAARLAHVPLSTWVRDLLLAHVGPYTIRQLPRWLPETT